MFAAMLFSQFSESAMTRIEIEDVNAAHFERLLRVIYTDTCFIGDRCAVERTVNIQHSRVQIPLPLPIFSLTVLHLSSEILDLLVLGKRFQVSKLVVLCMMRLKKDMGPEAALRLLEYAGDVFEGTDGPGSGPGSGEVQAYISKR